MRVVVLVAPSKLLTGGSANVYNSRKMKPRRNKYALACAMLASMSSSLLGYDIGVMSGAAIYIRREMKLSDAQIEVLLGILNIFCLVGAFAAGRTSDWIGRRYTIVLAGAFFFTGAILMGFSPHYAFLMFSRFVAGVGVGYAGMIVPVYITEISPASCRGFLVSLPDISINFGILLGYISNLGFSKLPLHLGWRFMLGLGAIPSIFIAVGVLAMPESPRWLVMQGRLAEAKQVMEKTSDSVEEAQLRLSDIKQAAGIPEDCGDDVVVQVSRAKKSTHGGGVWKELLIRPTPTVRRILLAGVGIHFFQQSSGIDAVVLYSPEIFEKAGITEDTQKLLATMAVGFFKTVVILVPIFFLDRVGRRPLLLSSLGGMAVSLFTLGTTLTVVNHRHSMGSTNISHPLPWAVALSIVSLVAFVTFFSVGMGPITGVYSSEILPLRLRAQGMSVLVAINRVVSGVVSMTFLSLSKAITTGGAFFLFSGIAAVGWLFFFTFLPETRGRTLESIGELFGEFKWKLHLVKKDGEQELATYNNVENCKSDNTVR